VAHAPARYRVNGPASNLEEFYEAFGVRPGNRLFREPAQRVRVGEV
jgi:putative endopeptidase